MRKYLCDRCGKEFSTETDNTSFVTPTPNLYTVAIYPNGSSLHPDAFKVGEYCLDCRNEIFKYVIGMNK